MPLPKTQLPDLNPEFVLQAMSEVYDWGLLDLNIPDVHKITMGANIKIGVIDSGKSEHFETINNTVTAQNFTRMKQVEDRNGHSCLHPDGVVFTTNGIETIEDFYNNTKKPEIQFDADSNSKFIGDLDINCISYSIKNSNFEKDKIEYVHKIPVVDDIFCIEFGKNRFVKLTHDHPVYTTDDNNNVIKKECQDLKIGDKLLCNNQYFALSDSEKNIQYGLYLECDNCGHKITTIKECRGIRQCKKCNKRQFTEKPYNKTLNADWAYLAGLILTDGHIHYQARARFIQICNADPKIINHAEGIYRKYGYDTKIYSDSRNPEIKTLTVCSKELCEFFISVGIKHGNKTRNQIMPKNITSSPIEVINAFLAGVIDGDGHISKNRRVRIASGSLKFCKQMSHFLMSIGFKSRYIKVYEKSEKTIADRNCKFSDGWHIIIDNPFEIKEFLASDKKNMLSDESVSRRKTVIITDISKEKFDGYFYDFTVKNNHNYQGNGVIISNTFCSGIIAAAKNDEGIVGVAPEAKLYFAKAMNDSGSGDPHSMVNAVHWCIKQKVDIISISAGMFFDFKPLHEAIKKAYNQNIIILAATGNTGTRNFDVAFPARYPEVIGVAAYDENRHVANFSSRGANVAFAMPGVNVYSTHLNNQFVKSNGTSFACPTLAGVCALILAEHRRLGNKAKTPCNTPKQMMEHLERYAINIGDQKSVGFGTIDTKQMFEDAQ